MSPWSPGDEINAIHSNAVRVSQFPYLSVPVVLNYLSRSRKENVAVRHLTCLLTGVLLAITATAAAAAPARPNVVFFLVDDLGWRDLGCYGSPFYETPNARYAPDGPDGRAAERQGRRKQREIRKVP